VEKLSPGNIFSCACGMAKINEMLRVIHKARHQSSISIKRNKGKKNYSSSKQQNLLNFSNIYQSAKLMKVAFEFWKEIFFSPLFALKRIV